jgi:glycosyltransferase involved in cell wall biosynthesis
MSSIDVSIVIPTYNRADLLPQAIDSCLVQQQTPLKLQIIIIDDCSTDNTVEILKKYGNSVETIFLDYNSKQCKARNVGLQYAIGDYVKFLDSDDILAEGSLFKELSVAKREKADIVISGWGTVKIDKNGKKINGTEKIYSVPFIDTIPDSILLGRSVVISAALYKSDYIKGLEWDENINKLTDWDWFVRAALRSGKIVALNEISYWMRAHEGPRVTTLSSLLENAQNHHKILNKIERLLSEQGELTVNRKKRLAQYYYKELRVLSLYDRDKFEKAVEHIYSLDPNFIPIDEERQRYMRFLGRIFGIRTSILLHSFIKKVIKGL